MNTPLSVNGIDIETKSTEPNAWVLSIGMVLYDVRTLKQKMNLSLCLDPNCIIQHQLDRDISAKTLDWWHPKQPTQWSPSKAAQDWTWGGHMSTETALDVIKSYLKDCKKDPTLVHTMRGPDFDYVILNTLHKEMGRYFDVNFAKLDSHRTTERGLQALGFPPYNENEDKHISYSGSNHIEHVAVCDAAKEAYETAKYYHLLWWVRNHGYDKALEVAINLQQGIIEAIPNDK